MKVGKRSLNLIKEYRRFGFLVGGIFLLIGFWPLMQSLPLQVLALVVGGVLVGTVLVHPPLLGPVYRGWMVLGHGLGWINTRIIFGLLYYLLFTPIGLVMRLCGKDPLNRKFDLAAYSYKIPLVPEKRTDMKKQF